MQEAAGMTPSQSQTTPNSQTVRVEMPYQGGPPDFPPEPPPGGPSAGRIAAICLLLFSVMLIAAGAGFALGGGRLPLGNAAATPTAPVAAVIPTDAPVTPPTTAPVPTEAPKPDSKEPTASAAPPTVAPAAQAKPSTEPTAPAAKPTSPPTAAPKPVAPTPAPPAKPTSPPAAATKPAAPAGADPRLAPIEARIDEYFAALNAQDYARAQNVCCTPSWRSRYPLDEWERNFAGVTDLRRTNPPRYQRVENDVIVVDTDYTFMSGGQRRNFTLRWTFTPVGSEWQADLAEAFPQ